MAKSTYTLYINDAPEPMATSVSMFGAPCIAPLNPLTKNFWLMIITNMVRSICVSPIATWLPSKNDGSGQFHIICPIDIYIRGINIMTDATSLIFIFDRAASLSDCPPPEVLSVLFVCAPPSAGEAPYPAFSTADMISSLEAVPSTIMEFVRRLT